MFAHYGEAIKSLRVAAGVSRAELARRMAVKIDVVSAVEKAASMPDASILAALASALHLSEMHVTAAAGHMPDRAWTMMRENPTGFLTQLSWTGSGVADGSAGRLGAPVLQTSLGRLYNADCLDLLPTLPDSSVDLAFADPPFNLEKDYGPGVHDDLPEQHYFEWCCTWIREIVRVLRPGAAFFLYNLPKWNLRLGSWLSQYLEFRNWIAVDIKFSLPIPGRLYPAHYSLLYFTKGPQANRFSPPRRPIETCRHCGGELRDYGGYKDRMNPAGVNLSDVWTDLSPVRHSRFKRRKANELPLKMLDRILDIASQEGDTVLDPFGGSGTTYVAAELKMRRWVGSEIGDCGSITDRFGDIDRERALLAEIRKRVNVLFTSEALRLRSRNGHDTSRYQRQSNEPGSDDEQSLF